jgi:hypothetical protein
MDQHDFDRLARALARGWSRRSVLRRAAGSALAGSVAAAPLAAADGKDKDKQKDKDKDKERDQDRGQGAGTVSVSAPGGEAAATANQTVVQTNNQVCAGDTCTQANQQAVGNQISQTQNQAAIAGSQSLLGAVPTYWVDVACAFDAPAYRTTCTGTGRGGENAHSVRKITVPTAGLCAVVVGEESTPERRETVTRRVPVAGGDNEANAGTGGVANADASGGSVTIGDVDGNNADIAIDASGGTANADASGGDGNVAIAGGGGQRFEEVVEQVIEPATVTLTLEGNVAPGKNTTYWLDTEGGRRPAQGPSLVPVAEEPADAGAIVAEAWLCGASQPTPGFDWFGQCATPVTEMGFNLYSGPDAPTPLATSTTNAQGRARFGNLPPGAYRLEPAGALSGDGDVWCYAESDRVDANGNVLVEAGAESHVWSFVCGGPSGS